MEENKELQPEEKKTTKSGTTKKSTAKTTTTKKTGTSGTAKKTAIKSTAKKTTAGTRKKTTTGTTKKTTKKKEETQKVGDEREEKNIVEEKVEPIEAEKIEKVQNIEILKQDEKVEIKREEIKEKQQEQPKKIEIEQQVEEPKFKPAPKIEKKKKKHTFLKGILILVIIALVLFLIHFARNYVIVDSILARQKALKELTNYSFKMNYIYSNVSMEYYHKDNNIIMIRKNSDSEKVIIWSSKDTKEIIFLNPKELTATVDKENMGESGIYQLLPRGLVLNSENTRGFDFMYFITSETVNGVDCYKVQWLFGEETAWYNKEDGTMVKYNENGYETEYTDWKINQLTDEDMSRPNLMGYEVTINDDNQITDQNNEDDTNNKNQTSQESNENQVDENNE